MKKALVIWLVIVSAFILAFNKRNAGNFNIPGGWPKPVYNFHKSPLDDKKIQLGRLLFYDPILSKDSTISCASCHSPFNAFTHIDHSLSHGINGRMGNRNSPVLINLAWNKSFMWDGAVAHLDEQSKNPICNPLEMDETMASVVHKLQAAKKYPALFYAAFADSVISEAYILKSLSQFMLTLVSANAKYDKVKHGTEQFTTSEERGYLLFQKNCATCHTEPLFTSGEFENNGLEPDDSLKDLGQMKITNNRKDSLKFKIPTLRNIEYSAPYMHDGRFKTLGQVLNNYIRGLQHGPTLSPKLQKGIYLSVDEKTDMIAFLLTLSDKDFLTDTRHSFPGK